MNTVLVSFWDKKAEWMGMGRPDWEWGVCEDQ